VGTNVNADGRRSSATVHCFAGGTGNISAGHRSNTNATWTADVTSYSCAAGRSLYCFEQDTVQQTQIVPSGLVGHWRLDEISGLSVVDTSGSGNNGLFQNGMSLPAAATSGVMRGGFLFSGNGFIEFSSTSNLNFTGAATVSAWVKPSAVSMGVDRKIFANFNQTNKTGFKLGI
jgi:hypothetical protein